MSTQKLSHSHQMPSICNEQENMIENENLIHQQTETIFDNPPEITHSSQLLDKSIISDALDINANTPTIQDPSVRTTFGIYKSPQERVPNMLLINQATDETKEKPQNTEKDEQHTLKSKGDPRACLFVASLASSRTDEQLVYSVTEHFRKWGPLLDVKVLKDWMSRPYSFVQFQYVEHAHKAMVEAQNTVLDGRYIRIEHARVNRTIFVTRFSQSTTETDISAELEKFGPVEDVSIFNNLGVLRNKRHAFIRFVYRDDAINAYTNLQNSSKWTIEWAPNLPCQKKVYKESIYIGQLSSYLVTEAVLRERFGKYGNIKYLNLIKKNAPVSKISIAFAFIGFDNEASAKDAIKGEDNTVFLETKIRVQYRETKEFRVQRHNVAMQASQRLDRVHYYYNPPLCGFPTQRTDCLETFQPFISPYAGASMYYTSYYSYPHSSLPIPGMNFVPMGKLDTATLQGNVNAVEYTSPGINLDRFAMHREFNHGGENYTSSTSLPPKYTSRIKKSPTPNHSREQSHRSDTSFSCPSSANPAFTPKRSGYSQNIGNRQIQNNGDNPSIRINHATSGSSGKMYKTSSG